MKPTLVLLPGMDGTGVLFEPFVEALGTEQRVHAIAYPPTRALGYSELTEHALSALPLQGPIVLLGESFSGPVAVALAARCAEQVTGLILCCSFVCNPRPRLRLLMPMLRRAPSLRAPVWLAARALFGERATGDQIRLLSRALGTVSPEVLRARLLAVAAADVSSVLERLRIPLLYMQARHDRLVPPSALAKVMVMAPHTRLSVVDGPHALLQARPHETAQVVKLFVDGLSAAR